MSCACCGGTVPGDAKCCPHCGAVEYRGLWVLSPGRPALWVGGISGFLLGIVAGHGDVLSHLATGAVCAAVAVLTCGLLAWIGFPGRTPVTCKHCGGTVAPDAGHCLHCEAQDFGDTPDLNRLLLGYGAIFGAIAGIVGGIVTDAPGFLAHVQSCVVLGIVGAYAGAVVLLCLRLFRFFILIALLLDSL